MKKLTLTLIAGYILSFAYGQQGSLDNSFDPGTGFNSSVTAIAIQSDGKLLAGGSFSTYNGVTCDLIVRLLADGSIDPSFTLGFGDGFSYGIRDIVLDADEKILIGGYYSTVNGYQLPQPSRLNTDGSPDLNFNSGGSGANGVIRTLALQSDGKILIGGYFTEYNGIPKLNIARLNNDGTLDPTFETGGGPTGDDEDTRVETIAIQADGKIILGGRFTMYDGTLRKNIVRINSNGSLDASFSIGSGANYTVISSQIQPDGKILIGGDFSTFNGIDSKRIARLLTNGSIDPSFAVGTGVSGGGVTTISLQPDGKIIIGGWFLMYQLQNRKNLARIMSNGNLDPSFDPAGSTGSDMVIDSKLQADGRLLIGGQFETYAGISRKRIARVIGDNFTSIEEHRSVTNILTLYPNPANAEFYVVGDAAMSKGMIRIYTQAGHLMSEQTHDGHNAPINISHLSCGSYIVEILPKNESQRKVGVLLIH